MLLYGRSEWEIDARFKWLACHASRRCSGGHGLCPRPPAYFTRLPFFYARLGCLTANWGGDFPTALRRQCRSPSLSAAPVHWTCRRRWRRMETRLCQRANVGLARIFHIVSYRGCASGRRYKARAVRATQTYLTICRGAQTSATQ